MPMVVDACGGGVLRRFTAGGGVNGAVAVKNRCGKRAEKGRSPVA
jgi:hypothetical protein